MSNDPHHRHTALANTLVSQDGGASVAHHESSESLDTELLAGRYELQDKIGAGGFATVFRAHDAVLDREVALKVLRPELLGDDKIRKDFLARFTREAQIVARMEHPHLIPVYDTGIASIRGQEKPFIVMKMLAGQELEEIIEQGPMPIERVRRLAGQALEALDFVHAQGITHKDLKPSNFFVCKNHRGDEHLYVMDFGIAHNENDESGRITKTGTFSGTVQYLAPEYTLHQQVSPAIDVYQMGLIITEMLSGTPVVPNDTSLPLRIAAFIKREECKLPPEFEGTRAGQILARAFAYDVTTRYQNAGELLDDFAKLGDDDFATITGAVSAAPAESSAATVPATAAPVIAPSPTQQSTTLDTGPTEHYPAPMEAGPTKNNNAAGVIIAIIAVAIIALGGVVAFLLQSDPAPDTTPPPAPPLAKPAVAAPTPVDTPPEPPVTAPKVDEPAPQLAKIELSSTPDGATVAIDGEERGETPLTLELEKADAPLQLTLERKGFKKYSRELIPSEDTHIEIELEPKKKRNKPSRTKPAKDPVEVKAPPRKDPPPKDPPKEEPPKKEPRVKPTLPPEF